MSEHPGPGDHPERARRRRSDGERSRNAILRQAAQLATVEGIDGLSIGRLADAVGMSKSGLFAHFGSKEELQLATIDSAADVFAHQVTRPAAAAPTALERLAGLTEGYLHHAEDAYPGGCFFAALVTEVDTHPGPVRDRAVQFLQDWLALLEATIRDAQAEGTVSESEDAAQLAFEVEAFLFLGNASYVATRDGRALDRSRAAIARRLAAAA